MGSLVHLALGPFEVDWGKMNISRLHGEIFQPCDVTVISGIRVDHQGILHAERRSGASKPLAQVLARLELLGYTLDAAREEFADIADACDSLGYGELVWSFDDLAAALAALDVDAAAEDHHTDHDWDEFFSIELFDRLNFPVRAGDDRDARRALGKFVENLHPFVILRLLAENPANLSRRVTWHYQEMIDEGWIQPETLSNSIADVRRFLIVTEGSSDAYIIRKAFEILRPEIADFFYFVDMEEGYPFTGTGNLYRFSRGLVAIGIENRVIVLYDNDLEGSLRFRDTSALNLPSNMRVVQLPALPQLTQFPTVGPNGEAVADINGRAAAIECYLDLAFGQGRRDREPAVRWAAYDVAAEAYQGVLEFKEKYAKRFLNLRMRDPEYDFSKLEAVLTHIVETCVSMAAPSRLSER
jgi:hypothetical protein